MNAILKISSAAALLIPLLLSSCKKEGCTDEKAVNYSEEAKKDNGSCIYKSYTMDTVVVGGQTFTQVSGTIDESLTFYASSTYLLSGAVFVANEATLTIEAGTNIYAADDGNLAFLSITRGSKINASGTATKPIVFSSLNPTPGHWGGIILNGYANTNNGNPTEPTGSYGGALDNDNSGVLRYVRVEYAGRQISSNRTGTAFAFNALGSLTSLIYLQSYRSAGDGFGFVGGTADLKFALSYGSHDDGFDLTQGWNGTGMYWRVKQDSQAGDAGIMASNNEASHGNLPYTQPALSHIELLGSDTSAHTVGLRLFAGSKAQISDLYISDFYTSLEIEHDVTLTNVVNGDLRITNATAAEYFTMRSFIGSKDDQGIELDPALVMQAGFSNNIVIDGTATANGSWITGSWYRDL